MQKAGRSSGLRLETKWRSTTTGASSQMAPALIEVILDAGRAGDADAAVNAGGDRDPAAVADGGDEFAGVVEVADELEDVRVAAELVGHAAAGDDDAVEVARLHVGDRRVGDTRIAVLPYVASWPRLPATTTCAPASSSRSLGYQSSRSS